MILTFIEVMVMVLNATFNNISVVLWRSVLLVKKPEYPEKTTNLSQVNYELYHIISITSPSAGFELTTLVVIVTDCTCICKSNYNTIMTAPTFIGGGK